MTFLVDRSALAQPEPAEAELPRAWYVRQPEPEPESPESDGHFVKKKRASRNGTEYGNQKREGKDAVENGAEMVHMIRLNAVMGYMDSELVRTLAIQLRVVLVGQLMIFQNFYLHIEYENFKPLPHT